MTLLDALKELQKRVGAGEPPEIRCGICTNVDVIGCDAEGFLSDELSNVFEALGLKRGYPIDSDIGYWAHVYHNTLWVGAQREARLALIAKCISHLEWQALATQEANHA